jgi:diaminopimelate decarboxylase
MRNITTPAYVYDLELLNKTLSKAKIAADQFGYHIHYALKANYQNRILGAVLSHGFGADCVSGGEIQKALDSGFKSEQIFFAGVGKTDQEILLGLQNEIACFNCESIEELAIIQQLASKMDSVASVAIRVNPGVDAKTHAYITTGLAINKFGIQESQIKSALAFIKEASHIKFKGFHFHIGSQITDLSVFKQLALKVNDINQLAFDFGFKPKIIDLGGGLGINYENPEQELIPNFEAFFAVIHSNLLPKEGQEVHFELGRSLVGQCASLYSKVLYVKDSEVKQFVIIDAGMTDLMRPALYQAEHAIENLSSTTSELKKYDVVGPICESSDLFGKDIELPLTKRGDTIRLRSVGAYGEVLTSNYNLRKKPSVYFIRENKEIEQAF